jgi:stage II sporulation protein AA (anti-sigma F factor antagonist)
MKITTEKKPEVMVVHTEGQLDAMTAGEFEKEVSALILHSKKNILLDFEKLDYISSAGLRSLLILAKELKSTENILALCSLNETINQVFCIGGFDSIITIYPTIEEGLASMTGYQ